MDVVTTGVATIAIATTGGEESPSLGNTCLDFRSLYLPFGQDYRIDRNYLLIM